MWIWARHMIRRGLIHLHNLFRKTTSVTYAIGHPKEGDEGEVMGADIGRYL